MPIGVLSSYAENSILYKAQCLVLAENSIAKVQLFYEAAKEDG